tara:strand:+ start:29398 stop:29991 length:594 start_codon:yes stop_codon:yes gene_type:complete
MSGVININSYIGKIYNNSKILNFEYFKNYKKSRQPFYKIICLNCNKKSIVGLWQLRSNLKKSPRCVNCKINHSQLPKGQSSINIIYRQYMTQSKNRGYDFKLSKEEFTNIINKNCYYCNSKPSNLLKNQNNTGDYIYNGIDRKDNNKGYVLNNCVPSCYNCNRCKSDMTFNDFIKWIEKVYNNFNKPNIKKIYMRKL